MWTNSDRERFAVALARLATAMGRPLDQAQYEVYAETLADMDVVQIEVACYDLMRTWKGQRFPTTAELRDAVLDIQAAAKAKPLGAKVGGCSNCNGYGFTFHEREGYSFCMPCDYCAKVKTKQQWKDYVTSRYANAKRTRNDAG